MNKIRYFVLIFFIFTRISGVAQNHIVLDSLNVLLKTAPHDSVRVNYLIEIAYEFRYSDPDTSLFLLTKAENLAKNSKLEKESIRCLTEKGYVYWVETKLDTAIFCAQTSLIISKKKNYHKISARAYQLLGMCHRDLGNYLPALENLFNSLKISEQLKNEKEIANCYNNIGEINKLQNNNELALEYYEKSMLIREKIDDKHGLARIYNNISELYIKLNKLPEALKYLYKSQEINKITDNKLRFAQNYMAIAEIFKLQNQPDSVIIAINKALEINQKIKNLRGTAECYNALAKQFVEIKNYSEAKKNGLLALNIAQKEQLQSVLQISGNVLYQVFKFEDNTSKALFYFEISQTAKDSIYNAERDKKADKIRYSYEIDKKQKELEIAEKDKKLANNRNRVQQLVILSFAGALLSILIFYIIVVRSRKKLKRLYNIATEQKSTIEQKNVLLEKQKKKITDSITYAGRIQHALLPSNQSINESFNKNFIIWLPKDIVSGDFYYCKSNENNLYFGVADCTGHGVPGALMSMLGIAYLNEILSHSRLEKPSLILNELRNYIKQSLKQNEAKPESKDGIDIAFCTLNKQTRVLNFAGAHTRLIYIRKEENSFQLHEIKADRMPVGAHPKDAVSFTNHEIQLQAGDRIYLFSDGLESQFGGEKGNKFMTKKLKETLMNLQNLTLPEQKQAMLKIFYDWKGNKEQIDDILIFSVEIE